MTNDNTGVFYIRKCLCFEHPYIICQAKCEDLPLEGSENATESKNATFAEENNDDLAVFEDYKSDEKPEFTSAKHVLLGHLTNI